MRSLLTDIEERRPGRGVTFLIGLGLCAIAVAVVWAVGSTNPFTPAGYVGYMTKGAVMGQSRFYGIQRGPTSRGRTWLLDVTNISITPYTYTEDFSRDQAVLSRDNLKFAFQVHTVWGEFTESHGGVHSVWRDGGAADGDVQRNRPERSDGSPRRTVIGSRST
jgi:hypothetical protein